MSMRNLSPEACALLLSLALPAFDPSLPAAVRRYQIRKMVGLALAVYRGMADSACIAASLEPSSLVKVPMAPATGLLMDEATYERPGGEEAAPAAATARALPSKAPCRAACDAFKSDMIYPEIAAADPAELWNFLKSINEAQFAFSKWNAAGQWQGGGQAAANKRQRT